MSTETAFERLSADSLRLGGSGSVQMWFHPGKYAGGYTAVIECKPRGHRYRLLRERGTTLTGALRSLERAVEAFEAGKREGEQ